MTDQIARPVADLFANPLVSTGLTLVGIALVALWLAAAWWSYQDASRRSESTLSAFLAAAWIIVSTPLMLPVALAIYAFARPQLTAADHRARRLVGELTAVADGPACLGCRVPIESRWLRCPACGAWLAAPCRNCGVWSARDLEACPYCGSEEHAAPVGARIAARQPAATGAGYGTAAAGVSPAAAAATQAQRIPAASSARPFSYATSRDASSNSS